MHVAIRVDGGPEIGYGHLVRSGSLAEEILSRGHTITIVTTTPQPAQAVFPDDIEIRKLASRGDPKQFVKWLKNATPDIVFTDAYPVDTEYQRAVRNQITLAVLQDDARHRVCADLFVNGNLYAPDLDYEFKGDTPKLCLGTGYVLLRREIRNHIKNDLPWRSDPERAIIIMGGSDIINQTPTVIQAFDGFNLHIDAIVGPGVSEIQEQTIRTTAEDVSARVRVERDPNDLAERMFQADFAVSTASSTTYELLALGTPIVSIPVVDNQEPIAAALRERDAATVLDRDAGENIFRCAIEEYISDNTLRRKRHKFGRELVDGKGTKRVTDIILSMA